VVPLPEILLAIMVAVCILIGVHLTKAVVILPVPTTLITAIGHCQTKKEEAMQYMYKVVASVTRAKKQLLGRV
jgi:hypothetical protein